jgi:hypothetical protein
MGVKGLQSFIKSYSKSRSFDELLDKSNQKLRIGIDISFYIYRWQADVEKILKFIRSLESNKHRILLAFDGRAEDGKALESQRRREAREQELQSASKIQDLLNTENLTDDERFLLERQIAEHQKKGWSLTKDVRRSLKERFYEEKIPMVKAKGEADGLLAAMSARGDLDIIISGDMDLLAMGAKVMWAPTEDGYHFKEYNRESLLEELKMTDWQFRSLCALCFTETCQEQNNLTIQEAYQLLKVFRSLTVLRQKYPNWLTTWPDDNHIFYRSVENVEPWIKEDQMDIYKAFLNCEQMPYT